MKHILSAAICTLFSPLLTWAASPFADNMVLQRDQPVPIWGRTTPGCEVTVRFAGQNKSTKADAEGNWSVSLDPLPASEEEHDLVIQDGTTRTLHNVLIGEVWLCSGQSNMGLTVEKAAHAAEEIAGAKDEQLRLLGNDISDGWKVCSPETVGSFSATAYYFGRQIRRELKVPVGLISLSQGGTDAARWTPRATLQADRDLWNACLPRVSQGYAREAIIAQIKAARKSMPVPPLEPWDDFVKKRMGGLYEKLIKQIIPYGIRGIIWYQGEADSSYPEVYAKLFQSLILSWRQGWKQPDLPFLFVQLPNFNTPLAGKWVRVREAQAQALALNHTGMAVTLDIGEDDNLHPLNKQEVGRRLALLALTSVYHQDAVSQGPIYQSFAVEPGQIRLHFRKSTSPLKLLPGASGFSIASDSQHFVPAQVRNENGDLIVWSDIVPKPVAVRYAWEAAPKPSLFNELGLPAAPFRTDAWPYPWTGPIYDSANPEVNKMKVKFAPSSFGLKLGDKTSRDFQIAGSDHKFFPAQVSIDGSDLLVWSDKVPQPSAVRYAWGNDELEISLFDTAGQAASPFRTDNWPEP